MTRSCRSILSVFLILHSSQLFAVENLSIGMFFSKSEKKGVLENKIFTRVYLKSNENENIENAKIKISKTRYTNEDFSDYEMISVEKGLPNKVSRYINNLLKEN